MTAFYSFLLRLASQTSLFLKIDLILELNFFVDWHLEMFARRVTSEDG